MERTACRDKAIVGWSPGSQYGLCWHGWGGAIVPSVVNWLFSKFSVLLVCPLLGPLVQGSVDFCWIFLSVPNWHFQVGSFSRTHSGICAAKRKPRNSPPCRHSLDPEVLSWSAFSLPTRTFISLLYILCPEILVVFGKSTSIPSSCKKKFLEYTFTLFEFCAVSMGHLLK